jgi:hypothetical protein
MNTTAEDIYTIYHRETNLAAGRIVKTVKNFTNAKAKDTWVHFEKCANFITRNRGQVNAKIFIKSLAAYYEGWFDPKFLGGQRSIKIYKEYVKTQEEVANPAHIRTELLRSIAFVSKYCKTRGIDFDTYIMEDQYLIPTILKHFNAGSVSLYFMSSVAGMKETLESFPQDVVYDYIPTFNDTYPIYRMRILSNKDTKNIADNLELLIKKLIYKVD